MSRPSLVYGRSFIYADPAIAEMPLDWDNEFCRADAPEAYIMDAKEANGLPAKSVTQAPGGSISPDVKLKAQLFHTQPRRFIALIERSRA